MSVFENRLEAGRLLGQHLRKLLGERPDAVVLGIPRGGVVVAAMVAEALGAPLEVTVPRKIGAPGEPELAIGAIAVAAGEEIVLVDEDIVRRLGIPTAYVVAEAARQRREIERRLAAYRGGRPEVPVQDRTAVLVDDGIATGLTARVAADAVARQAPREMIVAAPVAPAETKEEFRHRGLRLEVLITPVFFTAVGQFYRDFSAVEDEEVQEFLRRAAPLC